MTSANETNDLSNVAAAASDLEQEPPSIKMDQDNASSSFEEVKAEPTSDLVEAGQEPEAGQAASPTESVEEPKNEETDQKIPSPHTSDDSKDNEVNESIIQDPAIPCKSDKHNEVTNSAPDCKNAAAATAAKETEQEETAEAKKSSGELKLSDLTSSSNPASNCILFYGVTYLGCSSVNAPKSEAEISRIMATLNNEQGKMCLEVAMAVPQSVDDKIVLFDSTTELKISEYRMSQVLFVVRGQKTSSENSCFAFTTCHGDSLDNLMFSCHVFRCQLVDAVSKIIYSFWSVFNRHQLQLQQNKNSTDPSSSSSQQGQKNRPASLQSSENSSSSSSFASGQLSSVASSLLGSLYGSLPQTGAFGSGGSSGNSVNSYNTGLADYALKFEKARSEDQYVFKATLEIKEEDPKNPLNFVSVPKDKEYFKLRKNLDKQINIHIQQLTNQPLEIERCFGILVCPGRNVSHKDMQLLQTISMGSESSSRSSGSSSASSNSSASGYLVSAHWDPRDPSMSALQVLNEETLKNMRVFMTVAVDLVINGLQDPVRFCIETKARIFGSSEKFWVYQKTKHHEEFYLQIVKNGDRKLSSPSTSNHIYSLQSIHSQAELLRKKHTLEHNKNKAEAAAAAGTANTTNDQAQSLADGSSSSMNNTLENSDDENELVMSGLGNVSKDCAQEELLDWSDLLSRWRKTTWNERPRGLQSLVRKGIPEALRGEVWQLLAGCNEDEKNMNESYRLLLSKDSASEQVILRDINRTFPGHPFFQEESGQQALYKLSKAYSIYDEEVGYCQGLSFLIASLLLHMPEEQAFNLLVKIMYRYEIREVYKTNFECLHLRFYQLESLMQEYLPDLYEHFVDLNIEVHMFASQWFLTLYTAKFPLYMVFRILDLFLYEGLPAIFSVALALLKGSQRDLLALDFEGVLKYFRVSLPKKYRAETNFQQLIQIWVPIHAKLTDKKLKKLEKNYKQMKEAEALKDPLVRYEKECKDLTTLVRRLEQENDDLANEYIDNKMALTKQVDELRDENEQMRSELARYKADFQNKMAESNDTNKKLMGELDQIKQLWRKHSDKYESELERNTVIISEYKQICNTLSGKVEKWSNFRKRYEARAKRLNLCDTCTQNNKIENETTATESAEPPLTASESANELSTVPESATTKSNTDSADDRSSSSLTSSSESLNSDGTRNKRTKKKTKSKSELEEYDIINSSTDGVIPTSTTGGGNKEKIKFLELELARVKLELVDAQCKNQELDHKLKNINNSSSSTNGGLNSTSNSNTNLSGMNNAASSSSTVGLRSNSQSSASESQFNISSSSVGGKGQANHAATSSNLVSSLSLGNAATGGANSNNWLSKTFTQFKEATNQVVQKAQKVKIPAPNDPNNTTNGN